MSEHLPREGRRAREVVDVVVVGSGPNGLAAAVTMARAGLEVLVLEAQDTVGGGARTLDLGLAPDIRHDLCSAVHPLALASPFLRAFDLSARGVSLVVPEVSYAQVFDGGAALAWRDLERTAAGLGADGPAWRSLLGPLVAASPEVVALVLGSRRALGRELAAPRAVRAGIAFALGALEQGSFAWDARWRTREAAALLTGVAAHAISPLPGLAPAGTMLLLASLAHAGGWPLPVGGSQAIVDALVADLEAHGGRVRTGTSVHGWRELPRARAYLMALAPRQVLEIWRDRLPPRVGRGYERFRYGNAAAKVDFVLSGPVPWRSAEVGRAGAVHVGGTRAEMVAAEAAVASGRHAGEPMVLVSDPTGTDPRRESRGLRPLWAYAHVPAGSQVDMTQAVTERIERFAPGFRDVVVASRGIPAAELAHHDATYVGGDIAAGALGPGRVLRGPAGGLDPYATGIPGVSICSASTPPGPGVHGMAGWLAARALLRGRFGLPEPELAPH